MDVLGLSALTKSLQPTGERHRPHARLRFRARADNHCAPHLACHRVCGARYTGSAVRDSLLPPLHNQLPGSRFGKIRQGFRILSLTCKFNRVILIQLFLLVGRSRVCEPANIGNVAHLDKFSLQRWRIHWSNNVKKLSSLDGPSFDERIF